VPPEAPAGPGAFAAPPPRQWPLLAVLVAYFHVFMEWLFFATKPSFLSPFGFGQQLGVLFGTAGVIAISAALLTLVPAVVASRLPRGQVAAGIGLALPTGLLAASGLLLIDNFSYTMFGFGVLTTRGPVRWLYALLFVFLFAAVLRRALRLRIGEATEGGLRRFAGGLLLASVVAWSLQYAAVAGDEVERAEAGERAERMPDILMLASDGVEASHMSAYGAKRETTPFIASRMDRALVVENAFPNATATAGSVVSMLTSKLPTHTQVYQYQNILTGRNSYEHLPGILRDIGYRSIHVSLLLFADPSALPRPWNMQNAFDDYEQVGTLPPGLALAYSTDAYFFAQLVDRLLERGLHSLGIGREQLKFEQMLSATGTTDAQRIDAVLDFMEASERPSFAHLHLMDTHKPYRARREFWNEGETKRERQTDLYDSTIRTFDEHVEAIVERLRASGRLEHTIIVLSSDHGRDWTFRRVPLMFFFPDGAERGVVRGNVSMIDVAPTLLEYLGQPIPSWMEGQSLLAGEPDPLRPILSVEVVTEAGPPFPQMGRVGITVCDRSVWLGLTTGRVKIAAIRDHSQPCDPAQQPPPATLRAAIVSDLERNGYDVSHLRARRRAKPGG
jgi:hypothetical protein